MLTEGSLQFFKELNMFPHIYNVASSQKGKFKKSQIKKSKK